VGECGEFTTRSKTAGCRKNLIFLKAFILFWNKRYFFMDDFVYKKKRKN